MSTCNIVIFVTAGFLKLIYDLLNFVGLQVLKYIRPCVLLYQNNNFSHPHGLLIKYIKNPDDPTWRGYIFMPVVYYLCLPQDMHSSYIYTGKSMDYTDYLIKLIYYISTKYSDDMKKL